jgi:succinoglycan biosynthesis protein ExoM
MSENRTRVCVAIPTFRRPQLLETLLGGIARQDVPARYSILVLVIDNDTIPSAGAFVDGLAEGYPFRLEYVHEAKPGLSSVRNFALSYVRGSFDFLAMIDDDECPEPHWLRELLRVQRGAAADVVIGPVTAVLPAEAPRWVRRGRFHELPSYPDGASIAFGYSGNCLLQVSSLARYGVTFDPALNFAGGEDMLFFRELISRGARLAYASQATVFEAVGPERLRASYFIRLNFRRGNTLSICDRRLRGNLAGLLFRAVKSYARFALGGAGLVPLAVVRGRAGGVAALCDMARGLGSMYGLLGYVYRAYGRDEATRA